ncbi:hypothetical protein H3146_14145 [Streptomyces sp. OF3]|uniref:Uncharacterized protein n=2 Tax=Streptomyces alkaliterrae TaxID=2213162 RepID=A0A5P0YSM7_9ACTN|nr:hypothetical protein [Streptomyces alkaliterrae]MBB1261255.1 hypothetical protein [Streptomyces alkaliterrae]MQS03295.1 hypothetical protein [Streptomyces alkaliterrae]
MHAAHAAQVTPDAATPAESEAAESEPGGPGPAEPEAAESEPAESEGPRPLGVAVRPTGHQEIDAALARLADADHLAVGAHVEVYEDVHRGLRATLTALDQHEPGS